MQTVIGWNAYYYTYILLESSDCPPVIGQCINVALEITALYRYAISDRVLNHVNTKWILTVPWKSFTQCWYVWDKCTKWISKLLFQKLRVVFIMGCTNYGRQNVRP